MKQFLELLKPVHAYDANTFTVEDLHKHIATAIALEHATLPPYFTALASLKGDLTDKKQRARGFIHQIMMEEMLHMALAGNMMLAANGKASLTHKGFMPQYPCHLPLAADTTVEIHIRKCTNAQIESFVAIEKPATPQQIENATADHYESIGQFYHGLWYAFLEVFGKDESVELPGADKKQISWEHDQSLITIRTLADVRTAIDTIIEQGEGQKLPPPSAARQSGNICESYPQYTDDHYKKFVWVSKCCKFTDADTYPMKDDPATQGEAFVAASEEFDKGYSRMLRALEEKFQKGGAINRQSLARKLMESAAENLAELLEQGEKENTGYGPTFVYYPK
jgi:hypothetical protein